MKPTVTPIEESTDDLEEPFDEDALVHAWRVEQLLSLGLLRWVAELFADLVDWHALADLVGRGCPAELALEIVR